MRITIALALLIIAGGCRKSENADRRSDNGNVAPPVGVSIPRESVAITDSGPVQSLTCGVSSGTKLTDAGIGELKPGRSVAEVKRLCDVASDAQELGAEGQSERIMRVRLGGETIPATIVDDKIWRLDIRTAAFTTSDSIGVDTPLRHIARMRGAQFAPGEDGVYGFVAIHCGLSFRFSLPLRPPSGGQWTAAAIDKAHGDAAVDRVLVTKCRR